MLFGSLVFLFICAGGEERFDDVSVLVSYVSCFFPHFWNQINAMMFGRQWLILGKCQKT